MARAYDVAEVRAAADKAMTGSTAAAGLEAARGIYVATIDDWLKGKKQWSAAKKTYDLACTCTVASKYASTWISYAEWCAERKKIQNATKQYQRALEMVQGEEMVSNMLPLLESAILF
jgi:Tfp pilus assembly protein PilF